MQTDVKATQPLAATGVFLTQTGANCTFRTRIKGVYVNPGATAGTVVIANGQGGTTLLNVAVPNTTVSGPIYMLLPGEGILAENGVYGTITNAGSALVIYG